MINDDDTVTLDFHMIENLETPRGGYTRATMEALGMDWHNKKRGWKHRLIGKVIPESQYALAYRGRLIKGRRRSLYSPPEPAPFWD